jgi:hypothetical protein
MDKTDMLAPNTVKPVKQARALGAAIVYAPITLKAQGGDIVIETHGPRGVSVRAQGSRRRRDEIARLRGRLSRLLARAEMSGDCALCAHPWYRSSMSDPADNTCAGGPARPFRWACMGAALSGPQAGV